MAADADPIAQRSQAGWAAFVKFFAAGTGAGILALMAILLL